MEMVWRPRWASSEHGALQAFSGFPSNVAVAPAGLVMIDTGCVAAMAGAGLAGGFSAGGFASAASAGVVAGGGMGLGFFSSDAAVGTGVGVGAGVAAGGAGSAAGGDGILVVCTWLESHGAACQPISASRPAATRIASRNGRKRAVRRSAVVVTSAPWARRAGGSIATGLAESTMVGSFKLPPRGMVFQPLLAAHAFSSAPANSWHVA